MQRVVLGATLIHVDHDSPNNPKCLLFDVDGVLLDGQEVYAASWCMWAKRHGLDPDFVEAKMHGRRPEETIAEVAPALDVAHEREVMAAGLARLPPIPAMEGAAALLEALSAGRWAIVTSSRERHIRRCFLAASLPIPCVAIYGDDVSRGKPAPDGYQKAAAQLGVDPSRCVVVEDSPAGVRSGLDAGCTVVALTTTHRFHALAAAHVVFPSLSEAARHLTDVYWGTSDRDAGSISRLSTLD